MDRIDITMTAMLRPSILKRTLEGIVNHIVDDPKRFRLIINIDPLGEKVKPGRVVKVAKQYFENVIYNISNEASFPKAVKWVWKNSNAAFILHYEDDWMITRDIDIKDMIKILNNNEHLSSLRLYKYKTPRRKRFKTFSCMWIYNEEGFYTATDWKRQFGLNPILIKRKFINQVLPRMKDNVNPEKQFRNTQKYMVPVIRQWNYGIYTRPGQKPLVRDIGRRWITKTKYVKPAAGKFLTWDKR